MTTQYYDSYSYSGGTQPSRCQDAGCTIPTNQQPTSLTAICSCIAEVSHTAVEGGQRRGGAGSSAGANATAVGCVCVPNIDNPISRTSVLVLFVWSKTRQHKTDVENRWDRTNKPAAVGKESSLACVREQAYKQYKYTIRDELCWLCNDIILTIWGNYLVGCVIRTKQKKFHSLSLLQLVFSMQDSISSQPHRLIHWLTHFHSRNTKHWLSHDDLIIALYCVNIECIK